MIRQNVDAHSVDTGFGNGMFTAAICPCSAVFEDGGRDVGRVAIVRGLGRERWTSGDQGMALAGTPHLDGIAVRLGHMEVQACWGAKNFKSDVQSTLGKRVVVIGW